MIKFVKGKINDICAIRLGKGEDVVEGIKKACIDNGIKNAVIISIIGSLERACYNNTIKDSSNLKTETTGTPLQWLEGPLEVVSAQGEICHKDDGELAIHIHGTFSDENGNAYGGHMHGGNKVLCTLNVFLGVIDGAEMGIEWDDEVGLMQFCPRKI